MEEVNSKQKEAVRGLIESTFSLVKAWRESSMPNNGSSPFDPLMRSSWQTSRLSETVSRMAGVGEEMVIVGLSIGNKAWPILDRPEIESHWGESPVWLTESQLIEVYRKADASDDEVNKLLVTTTTAQ